MEVININTEILRTIIYLVSIICATVLTITNKLSSDNFITIVMSILAFKAGVLVDNKNNKWKKSHINSKTFKHKLLKNTLIIKYICLTHYLLFITINYIILYYISIDFKNQHYIKI